MAFGLAEKGLFDRIFDDVGGIGGGGSGAGGGGSAGALQPARPVGRGARKHNHSEVEGESDQRDFKRVTIEGGGGSGSPSPIERSFEDVKKIFLEAIKLPVESAVRTLKEVIDYSNSQGYPLAKLNFKLLQKNTVLSERVSREVVDLPLLIDVMKKPALLLTIDDPKKCSETICLAALQVIPSMFREHVPSQKIKNVCRYMLRNGARYLKYVDEKLKNAEMCEYALKKGVEAFMYFPEVEKTKGICLKILDMDPGLFNYVPLELKTYEFCLQWVHKSGRTLADVPKNLLDQAICRTAMQSNLDAFEYVPAKLIAYDDCLLAIKGCSNIHLINVFRHIPKRYHTFEICLVGVNRSVKLLNEIKNTEIFYKVIEELFANSSTFTFNKSFEVFFQDLIALNPLIINKISDKYKRKVDWDVAFVPQVKLEMVAFIEHSSGDGSVDALLEKLRSYVTARFVLTHPYYEVIQIVTDRLRDHEAFLGTPQREKREALDAWYLHIKSLLKSIDQVIDGSSERDTESKEQLLQLFSVCGGGWQAQLEQMQSQLVIYNNAPPTIMTGLVIKKFTEGVIEQIYREYREWCENHLDEYPDMTIEYLEAYVVHSINYFHMTLKDYLLSTTLEDHLADVEWTDDDIKEEFFKKYTVEALVKELSEAYRSEGSALQEGLAKFIQDSMFKGCPTNPEFDAKIAEEREEFKDLLKTRAENREVLWYKMSVHLSTGIPRDEISLKTSDDLLKAFDRRHQIKVEGLAIEKFNQKYREEVTGLITDEGLKEILLAMGFLSCREGIFSP